MNRKSMGVLSLIIVLAMIAIAVWVASRVPDGAQLPIHWDASGQPNGYAGKWGALLLPAALTSFVSLLFYFLPALEPRKEHLERSHGLMFAGWGGLLFVNLIVELTVVSGALHWHIPVAGLMLVGVGLLFALIGNQLGKTRSMYLAGIRTPWTLSSEDVWVKTNRLGGKLMMAAGLIMVVASFLPIPALAIPLLIIGLVVLMVSVPVVYSYILWRREQASGQASG